MQTGTFETPLPEIGIPGPNQMKVSAFDKMRLHQLHLLADAYGVSYPKDCPKDEMIPVMRAAESAGVFRRGKIVDARKWAMLQNPQNPEMWPDDPEPEPVNDDDTIGRLRSLAKERGINSFGLSKEQLKERLGV